MGTRVDRMVGRLVMVIGLLGASAYACKAIMDNSWGHAVLVPFAASLILVGRWVYKGK